MRQKLIDLCAQRTAALNEAETALQANDQAGYQAAMDKVTNLNTEIGNVQNLLAEQNRQMDEIPANPAQQRDMVEDRANTLRSGGAVTFTADEVRRGIRNAVTLATGTIVQPTGAGSEIRDPVGAMASSIVDQVSVVDLTGMGGFLEPYVITDLEAKGGTVAGNAGKLRTESDPTFGVAEIRPYEVNVTSYVDQNISRLSPASYYQKVYGMAMRALRRKIAGLIINGDGEASPAMHGIVSAKNKAGADIFAAETLGAAIGVDTLDMLYFAYGSGEAMGANARMLLTKANLKALGALRGTNEKRRLLEITPDASNPNTGIIRDGGIVLPYTLVPDVGDTKLLYGDPVNYEMGLFGVYSIRVDSSYKAGERLLTILGDVMVGGNLVVDKGFVVGSIG